MLMRQAALLTALAAAGRAAFDACGEPTKGPVLGGLDVVARAWTRGGRILNLASSPDRTRVALTSPNERFQLFQLYDSPSSAKKGAFANLRRDVRRWDHVFGGRAGAVLR